MSRLVREANARHERHRHHASSRPLSDNYELVGLAGEKAWADRYGGEVDLVARPRGDGGRDHTVKLLINGVAETFVVDVKAARKPGNLIVEVGKCQPRTIYVLARYLGGEDAELLKWEWGSTLLKAPVKDFGYGIRNHYIPCHECRDLKELEARMVKRDVFEPKCVACGADANYGMNVLGKSPGTWYCREHVHG